MATRKVPIATPSYPRQPGPRAHRGAAVGHALRLHRLALAAVRDREQPEVAAHRVHVQEVVPRVACQAAVAEHFADLTVLDLVHLHRRDAEVLSRLGDGRYAVADDVVAFVDLTDYVMWV